MQATPPADRAAAIDALAARIAAVGSAGHSSSAGPDTAGTDSAGPRRGGQGDPPPIAVPDGEQAAKARDIVYRQLAAAPRSRATLAARLRTKEIPDGVAGVVLDRFERAGLIDDRAYAEAFVRAKHRDRALGRRALRAELRKQGVAEGDLAAAVGGIDPDAEAERAAELVDKKVTSALAAGPQAARRRLLGMLARRGYPADLATEVVETAIGRHGQD